MEHSAVAHFNLPDHSNIHVIIAKGSTRPAFAFSTSYPRGPSIVGVRPVAQSVVFFPNCPHWRTGDSSATHTQRVSDIRKRVSLCSQPGMPCRVLLSNILSLSNTSTVSRCDCLRFSLRNQFCKERDTHIWKFDKRKCYASLLKGVVELVPSAAVFLNYACVM